MVLPSVYQLPLFPFEKRCTRCGVTRIITEFTPQRRNADHFEHWCKPCRAAYYVAYRDGERLRTPVPEGFQVCCQCKELLPLTAFSAHRGEPRGRQRYCKECTAVRHHTIYRLAPAYRVTATRLKHKRRRREALVEHTLSARQWADLLERTGHQCLCCHRPFSVDLPATVDHIVPVSLGGGLTLQNVQPPCLQCNVAKGAQQTDWRPDHLR